MINIVCTTDNNYMQHCAVMLNSLMHNTPNIKFNIFIIYSDPLGHEKSKLSNFLSKNQHSIEFIEIDDSILKGAPISHHINLSTYYRLLIPDLLKSSLEKVLYLDPDIVIRKSVENLWGTNINEYSHAAISAPCISSEHKQNIGLSPQDKYFNAGILLINLVNWRRLKVKEKAINFIRKNTNQIKFWDQDALNHVLCNQWLELSPHWNAQQLHFKLNLPKKLGISVEEHTQTQEDPSIVHFTGSGRCKPWHYNCEHPFKDEYHQYIQDTPWKNYKLIGKPTLLDKLKARLVSNRSRLINISKKAK